MNIASWSLSSISTSLLVPDYFMEDLKKVEAGSDAIPAFFLVQLIFKIWTIANRKNERRSLSIMPTLLSAFT